MKDSTTLSQNPFASGKDAGFLENWSRRTVQSYLETIREGTIRLEEKGEYLEFGEGGSGLAAAVKVHDSRFYRQLLLKGSLGAGETYMEGFWDCTDLTALIRIFLRNRQLLASLDKSYNQIAIFFYSLLNRLRKNTPAGSRRNIAAHYDLGNDFFSLFLDSRMMYSSALFPNANATLEDASEAKLQRICNWLELDSEDHVMEIGSGWGGFAVFAARHYGCRVTTTTISPRQFEHASARVQQEGLGDRVEILLEDYRGLEGKYDKLVSIEMIEAVGHEYLDTYLQKCSRLLKADGLMFLQAILIQDPLYERARRSLDFIQAHIFPGSVIPSLQRIYNSLARVTDFQLFRLDDITLHYARTLRIWRELFLQKRKLLRSGGFTEEFIRKWEFYFCYCEAGFQERHISDVQFLLSKPAYRAASLSEAGPDRSIHCFQKSGRAT